MTLAAVFMVRCNGAQARVLFKGYSDQTLERLTRHDCAYYITSPCAPLLG